MSNPVGGLMPILATPFDTAGGLDVAGLRSIVEYSLESGVDGVAVFGMASEGFALRSWERREILDAVHDVVAGTIPVVAGVNATSIVGAVEQAVEAEEGGADALMVLPPYLVKPPAGSLTEFYGSVAESTSLSVMIQDAPGTTGVSIPPALIAELAGIDGIDSVKIEAPPTAPKVAAVVDAVADDRFRVIGGQNSQFCLEEYARGAVGTMPACEFSDLLKPVLQDWMLGEFEAARAGFQRLLPLILLGLQQGIAWSVHKEVLVARGIIESAKVRYPAAVIDDGTKRALEIAISDLGIARRSATAR